jgi:ribonucleoside-triphosphate reductase
MDMTVVQINYHLKEYLTSILERVYKYHIAYKTMLYDLEDKKMFAASNGGYISISKLYSTIGINGLNEAARFLGLDVSNNKEYIGFLQLILGTIKEQNKKHSINDANRPFLFNSEVVPAEGLGGKNYKWDFLDGYWVPKDTNLYNSYFYNAHDNTSVLDKFILHGRQTSQYCDGGSALHCNLDAHLSKEQYIKLIDFAIQEGTNYFTFNIPNSKCESCGHIVKAPITKCPKCGGEDITQYTRVIGYLRPIKAFGFDRLIEAGKRVYSKDI